MQTQRPSSSRPFIAELTANIGFGDAFIFLFLIIFFRQYLLLISGNVTSWVIAVPAAAIFWVLYVKTKPLREESSGSAFWITVALPLIFIYLLRAALPDVSFDVLNYRLLHSERSLHGLFYQPSEFFPTAAPYNPAPDTLTGLFRHALGYRLGTIVNLLVLIWSAQIIERVLRPFIAGAWPRAVCVLLIMLSEHVLFEINNYMVDLIALPLLLETTRIALQIDEAENVSRAYAHAAFLTGLSTAIKLTNAIAAAPLLLVFAYKAIAGKQRLPPKQLASTLVFALIALVAPVLPFSFYLWLLTGNPVFPLANKIFKSPYWPTAGGWDARWGPVGFWETIIWPVLTWLKPARHSELAVYSGRLSIGFLIALIALPFVWRRPRVRLLCLVFLVGCLMWSAAGMGYSRYGLYLELLSGIVVVAFAAFLFQHAATWRKVCSAFVMIALVVQVALACRLILGYEWSMRPTFLSEDIYRTNSRYLLRDRSLTKYLTTTDRALLDKVDVWIESSVKTTAIEALLKPGAPVIGVRNVEFFTTKESRQKFTQIVNAVEHKGLFTLTDSANFESSRAALAAAGLTAGKAQPISLGYFSKDPSFDLLLVEVKPEWQTGAANGPAPKGQPLPFNAFDAGISIAEAPTKVHPSETFTLKITLTNLSQIIWPGQQQEWKYQVTIGNFWLAENGNRLSELERRAVLTRDLAPGQSVELPLTLIAPETPGNYTLKIDAVQEGVAWFGDVGSQVLDLKIKVE
jgi:hypothetical protein